MAHETQIGYGPETWDEERAALFYRALGHAFSQWQNVETALFVVFHCLTKSSFETSSAIYFHMRSVDTRISLIRKLCVQQFGQEKISSAWKPLAKRLEINVDMRNAMAHFEICGVDLEINKLQSRTDFPFVMTPNYLDAFAVRSGQHPAVFFERLLEMPAQFTRLADDLIALCFYHIPAWAEQIELLPPDLCRVLKRFPGKYEQSEERPAQDE